MFKECPFCGRNLNHQDYEDTVYPADREHKAWQVVCQCCSATVLGESDMDAIKNWNTRTLGRNLLELPNETLDNIQQAETNTTLNEPDGYDGPAFGWELLHRRVEFKRVGTC